MNDDKSRAPEHLNTTTTTITHTVTVTYLLSVHTPHITWTAEEVHEQKIGHTVVIYPRSAEPKAH